ncbi:hypothetical protein KKE54_02315 [bacterium]|jgi:hypothetical protein|nr:hypothetical protein [bacterium]
MKQIILSIFVLLTAINTEASECTKLKAVFEKEESAYDTVARIAVASNEAYVIIGKFIENGEKVLQTCPKLYSLDRQYVLKRKLDAARQNLPNYRVFTQSEVGNYARSHPEEIVVYKWGTIRPVP